MNINGTARAGARQGSLAWALPALLLVGLVVRLLFINNEGFKTDVSTYTAWALGLSQHGFSTFYSTIGFADYPPGYFYILAAVGHFWHLFFAAHDRGFGLLRDFVKLPAIFADLGVGALLYAVVRRFAGAGFSLAAAALYVLNPATIYVSALWGQVDSISGGLALLAIYALLRSEDDTGSGGGRAQNAWIVGGWLAFAYSLLIKPQAAVLLPLLVAFAFVDPTRRRARLVASAIGIGAAILLALLLTEPFHPSNPIAAFVWLLERYAYGSNVYPYNSVNAFNLWAMRGMLWVPDTQAILGLKQYVWGVLLVLAALALHRVALRARTHVASVAGRLCRRHACLFRALYAHARALSFQWAVLYHRLHPALRDAIFGARSRSLSCFSPISFTLGVFRTSSPTTSPGSTRKIFGASGRRSFQGSRSSDIFRSWLSISRCHRDGRGSAGGAAQRPHASGLCGGGSRRRARLVRSA